MHGPGPHSYLMPEPGFNLRESDSRTCLVNLYSTLGGVDHLPPWGMWSGGHCELGWGRQEFLSLGKLSHTVCFLAEPPSENSDATKNDSGFLQGKPIFLIPSEKMLSVIPCSILNSFYSGHILTKRAESALSPRGYLLQRPPSFQPHLPFYPVHPFTNHN